MQHGAEKTTTATPLVRPSDSSYQTGPITSRGYCHRPLLAEQNMVPLFRPTGERNRALPGGPRPVLSRQARQARGGRTSRVERRGLSALAPSWLYTLRGAIGRALRPDRLNATIPRDHPLRTGPPRYGMRIGTAPAPWSANLYETFQDLLGTDELGVTAVALLSNSLAPSSFASYDSALRQILYSAHMITSPRYRPPRPQWFATQRGWPCSARSPPARCNPTSPQSTSSSESTNANL
jgi:hypothetical protein